MTVMMTQVSMNDDDTNDDDTNDDDCICRVSVTPRCPLSPGPRAPGSVITDHEMRSEYLPLGNNLSLSCHIMSISAHLVMLTLMVLLSLASMTAGGPQPGLDVESVADKIIKKIGKNFNLLLLCKRSFI